MRTAPSRLHHRRRDDPDERLMSPPKQDGDALSSTPIPDRRDESRRRSALVMSTVALAACFMVWTVFSIVGVRIQRSEEHTSELQSLMRTSYAVCCLQKNN